MFSIVRVSYVVENTKSSEQFIIMEITNRVMKIIQKFKTKVFINFTT